MPVAVVKVPAALVGISASVGVSGVGLEIGVSLGLELERGSLEVERGTSPCPAAGADATPHAAVAITIANGTDTSSRPLIRTWKTSRIDHGQVRNTGRLGDQV
ncbi:hypothetical protein LADH09A_005062 [Micromonospora sp. LAH09]|uniref:hypothetical protein n=1 Tax=Micromonospora cabrerizensis TaxID=2911213 RepID=UPI001EE9A349|nr:hypothetical protein [Micromonospora cabrerizensis]MCG5471084.1 hypothetical protein [Micromonospora cabrerizensis]